MEFQIQRARSGEPEIWLMNADGSGQHRLTGGLSPDGSTIAFSGVSDLSLIDANGSHRRTLPHTEGGEYPSWSPDGTSIAFNSNVSGHHLMYIARADGSKVVELTGAGEGWQVARSPDGRSILFTSHCDHADNYTDVYAMRRDGSDVRRLTHNRAYTPAWSPDGKHIVFSAPGLFVMNVDGTGITPLPRQRSERPRCRTGRDDPVRFHMRFQDLVPRQHGAYTGSGCHAGGSPPSDISRDSGKRIAHAAPGAATGRPREGLTPP